MTGVGDGDGDGAGHGAGRGSGGQIPPPAPPRRAPPPPASAGGRRWRSPVAPTGLRGAGEGGVGGGRESLCILQERCF